jgi:hypothetical protein
MTYVIYWRRNLIPMVDGVQYIDWLKVWLSASVEILFVSAPIVSTKLSIQPVPDVFTEE